MLLLFPDAVMMADDTNGPMNADVFPTYMFKVRPSYRNQGYPRKHTTENNAKKRNLEHRPHIMSTI
jgi:hypothetical protein